MVTKAIMCESKCFRLHSTLTGESWPAIIVIHVKYSIALAVVCIDAIYFTTEIGGGTLRIPHRPMHTTHLSLNSLLSSRLPLLNLLSSLWSLTSQNSTSPCQGSIHQIRTISLLGSRCNNGLGDLTVGFIRCICSWNDVLGWSVAGSFSGGFSGDSDAFAWGSGLDADCFLYIIGND